MYGEFSESSFCQYNSTVTASIVVTSGQSSERESMGKSISETQQQQQQQKLEPQQQQKKYY